MRGADRDGEIGVAGIGDRPFVRREFRPVVRRRDLPVAGIAGGDHDRDPRSDKPVDLDAERALPRCEPLRKKWIAEADIETVHLDVAAELVDLLEVTDRRQKVAHEAGLARAEDSQAHDLALGGEAEDRLVMDHVDRREVVDRVVDPHACLDLDLAPRGRARLARDDAGDMCPMTRLVDKRGFLGLRLGRMQVGKVPVPEAQRLDSEGVVRVKVRMRSIDPSVGDRPDDVLAGGGKGGAGRVALDRPRRCEDERRDWMILPNLVEGRQSIGRLAFRAPAMLSAASLLIVSWQTAPNR